MRLVNTGYSTFASSWSAPFTFRPIKQDFHCAAVASTTGPYSERLYCLVRSSDSILIDANKSNRDQTSASDIVCDTGDQNLNVVSSVGVARNCVYSSLASTSLAVVFYWHLFSFLLFCLALNVSCVQAMAGSDHLSPATSWDSLDDRRQAIGEHNNNNMHQGHRARRGDDKSDDRRSQHYAPYHHQTLSSEDKGGQNERRTIYELVMLGENRDANAAALASSPGGASLRYKGSPTWSRSRWQSTTPKSTLTLAQALNRNSDPLTLADRATSPLSSAGALLDDSPGRQCKMLSQHNFNALCLRRSAYVAPAWRSNGTRFSNRDQFSWRSNNERSFYRKKLDELRDTYLSSRQCDEDGADPMNLYDLFTLRMTSEVDLVTPSKLRHLNRDFADCLMLRVPFDRCRACFRTLLERVRVAMGKYDDFTNLVLSKVDCTTTNDNKIYSAITNCTQCKLWYRRWLLATVVKPWYDKPCMEWCHLVELACPHVRPSLKVEYAGLPSFRCTDSTIPAQFMINSTYAGDFRFDPLPTKADNVDAASSSSCVHPCDTWTSAVKRFVFFEKYCLSHWSSKKRHWTKKKRKQMAVSSLLSKGSTPKSSGKRQPVASAATSAIIVNYIETASLIASVFTVEALRRLLWTC